MKLKSSVNNLDNRFSIIQNEFDEIIDLLKEKIEAHNIFKNKSNQDSFIKEFDNSNNEIYKKIGELNSIRKKNTELGKNIIKNQIKTVQDIKNSALNSDDVSKIIHDLNLFKDKLDHDIKKMDNINYHHLGITMVGFFLALWPFYNVLAIGLGGYLIYSSDIRGKISGMGIITLVTIMLLYTRVILWFY